LERVWQEWRGPARRFDHDVWAAFERGKQLARDGLPGSVEANSDTAVALGWILERNALAHLAPG
jgi:hypothetical protein